MALQSYLRAINHKLTKLFMHRTQVLGVNALKGPTDLPQPEHLDKSMKRQKESSICGFNT